MTAFAALLRRGATTHDLTISDEWSPPTLAAAASIIGGGGTMAPRLVRESLGTPVEMTLPIRIYADTQPAFQAAVDALDAYLRGGECSLEITFTDAAAATIWTVYHAQPVQPPFTRFANVSPGDGVRTALQLVVSPFVTSPEVTLHAAAAFTAPDSVSLAAMAGNYRSPLTIDVNATNADLHALYLAIDQSSYDAYLTNATDLTWGAGHTDYADGDAFSGTAVKVASVTNVSASIDTADLPAGPYLLLARVKVLSSETGTITTDYGVDPSGAPVVVAFTRATWHIVELGRCYLPTRVVRGTAAANLIVSLRSSSATAGHEACVDWIYPLPLGDGMWSWHPATATTQCDALGRDADTATTYVDDVADEQHAGGNTLMALGGTLLIVSDGTDGDTPTHDGAITVVYTPRSAWMR